MDDEALLALYDRRRACSRALFSELLAASARGAMMTAGRRLGVVHSGTFVFDTPEESAVLGDACVYAVRDANGECAAQRVGRDARYPAESPEREVLSAMADGRFSLFTLSDPVPGVKITATDVFTGRVSCVVDRGLSATAPPMIAARLVDFPEFSMTTGAGIPVTTREEFIELMQALDAEGITPPMLRAPDRTAEFSDDFFYVVAAHLLDRGGLRRTRFLDPTRPDELAALEAEDPLGDLVRSSQMRPVTRDGPKVGRNDPCPCGSGKKHKKCHGR